MFSITPSARLRPSPFYDSTLKEGVREFTTYNNMLMPTGYGDPEGEYWRLINGVSQWDVAVERQVQLKGPDAGKLAQILAPRDLRNCKTGQGKYVPICNHDGILLNDPILLKVDEQCYWLSIADSNIWFWAKAVASERRLDVEVSEPDVSPMAIQGPKSDDVVASVFGDWVRELKYFWFRESTIEDIPVVVARSGWSKQGGYEIYLLDGSQGTRLWDITIFKNIGFLIERQLYLRSAVKRKSSIRNRSTFGVNNWWFGILTPAELDFMCVACNFFPWFRTESRTLRVLQFTSAPLKQWFTIFLKLCYLSVIYYGRQFVTVLAGCQY